MGSIESMVEQLNAVIFSIETIIKNCLISKRGAKILMGLVSSKEIIYRQCDCGY